jgi:hypothetical protein
MKHLIMHLTSARWIKRHRRGCKKEYGFFKNVCEPHLESTEHGSFVSWWQISERGPNQAKSGWNHRHRILDGTLKKQMSSDTFSGSAITRANQRDSRYVTLFSTYGNTKLKNFIQLAKDELSMARIGVSGPKWARLRFRSTFYNAKPKGWSIAGLVRWSYGKELCHAPLPNRPHFGAKQWPAALFSAGQ